MSDNLIKQWTGYLGFVIAVAGAAIGLGNIWKFPYMVGDNGGSSFVIVYMFFVVCLGLPLMLAEMVIGRNGKLNPVSSFSQLSTKLKISKLYTGFGWYLSLTGLCILSFYSVIAGLALAYLYDAIMGTFVGMDINGVQTHWKTFIGSPSTLLLWNTLFLGMSLLVIARGVQKGLERANMFLMPALYFILAILVIYAYFLDGFGAAIDFMFGFRFEDLTADIIIAAMGHAFFSLAVGAGCLLVYGAYLPDEYSIGKSVWIIAVMSIVVALMSGIAIFSIIFTYDLPNIGGAGLMFEILPIALATMPYGYYIGGLFFLMIVFAAWTSSISFIEVLVSICEERYKISRIKAVFIVGVSAWLLGIGSVFSFNIWSDPIIGGRNYFVIITDLSTNILLPTSCIMISFFAGWKMTTDMTRTQLGFEKETSYNIWKFITKWLVPICIIIVMINSTIN